MGFYELLPWGWDITELPDITDWPEEDQDKVFAELRRRREHRQFHGSSSGLFQMLPSTFR